MTASGTLTGAGERTDTGIPSTRAREAGTGSGATRLIERDQREAGITVETRSTGGTDLDRFISKVWFS